MQFSITRLKYAATCICLKRQGLQMSAVSSGKVTFLKGRFEILTKSTIVLLYVSDRCFVYTQDPKLTIFVPKLTQYKEMM